MAGETIIFDHVTRPFDTQLPTPQQQQRVVVLHLPEFRTCIPLPRFTHKATLGRCDPVSCQYPDIDFSPYAAHQKGVSRQHVVIHQAGQELLVKDMGSVNGTYLNGHRLISHQLYPLKDGDELILGMLMLQVQSTLES